MEPRCEKIGLRGIRPSPTQNRAVQPQKMARGMKFRIYEVGGLYYPCSENKGADQLRGYQEADLRLCFRIYKKPVFSQRGSMFLGHEIPFYSADVTILVNEFNIIIILNEPTTLIV